MQQVKAAFSIKANVINVDNTGWGRSIKSTSDILVYKKNSGQWIFNLELFIVIYFVFKSKLHLILKGT